MKFQRGTLRAFLIIFLLASAAAFAQAPNATLNGKVIDQTGAVIPQATVTITASNG